MATAEKKRPRISSGAGRRTSRKEVHLFSLPQILFSLVGMQSPSSFFPAYSIVCSYPLMHSCACYGHGQSNSGNLVCVCVPKIYLLPLYQGPRGLARFCPGTRLHTQCLIKPEKSGNCLDSYAGYICCLRSISHCVEWTCWINF